MLGTRIAEELRDITAGLRNSGFGSPKARYPRAFLSAFQFQVDDINSFLGLQQSQFEVGWFQPGVLLCML